jgi:hypothetical protein
MNGELEERLSSDQCARYLLFLACLPFCQFRGSTHRARPVRPFVVMICGSGWWSAETRTDETGGDSRECPACTLSSSFPLTRCTEGTTSIPHLS